MASIPTHWFAEVLEEWRANNNATQRQLASHMGVDEERVSTWLSGSWPRPDKIEEYLRRLGVDIGLALRLQQAVERGPIDPASEQVELEDLRYRVAQLERRLEAIRALASIDQDRLSLATNKMPKARSRRGKY